MSRGGSKETVHVKRLHKVGAQLIAVSSSACPAGPGNAMLS